jgi:hypothetical protein
MRGVGVFLLRAVFMGAGRRFAVFFQWQRQGEEQLVSAIDAQQAIQLMILPHWPVLSQDPGGT